MHVFIELMPSLLPQMILRSWRKGSVHILAVLSATGCELPLITRETNVMVIVPECGGMWRQGNKQIAGTGFSHNLWHVCCHSPGPS